jgi:hypothetical protein
MSKTGVIKKKTMITAIEFETTAEFIINYIRKTYKSSSANGQNERKTKVQDKHSNNSRIKVG